jgi:hypothetical protein
VLRTGGWARAVPTDEDLELKVDLFINGRLGGAKLARMQSVKG